MNKYLGNAIRNISPGKKFLFLQIWLNIWPDIRQSVSGILSDTDIKIWPDIQLAGYPGHP